MLFGVYYSELMTCERALRTLASYWTLLTAPSSSSVNTDETVHICKWSSVDGLHHILSIIPFPRMYRHNSLLPRFKVCLFKHWVLQRQRAAHKVPLLSATASRVIDMEDVVATSTSSGTPALIDKSPLDFSNEDPPSMITNQDETKSQIPAETSREAPPVLDTMTIEVAPEVNLEREVTAMGSILNKRHHKRDQSETEANAPPKVLRTDHASVRPESHTRGGRSLAVMGLGTGSIVSTPIPQETPADVIGPDPLSYARPQSIPERNIAQSSKGTAAVKDPESEKSTSFTSLAGLPGGIYQPGWGMTNDCRLDTPDACQDMVDHSVPPGYLSELRHLPNPEFLS
ncbi:hypothetical protein Tco_0294510 [Tanacetum coccineum]